MLTQDNSGPRREQQLICAVIVTLNPDHDLGSRVDAILKQVDRLIIVDNGSSPSAQKILQDVVSCHRVGLIANDGNYGIAKALNQGITQARDWGCKWALTLDQDSSAAAGMVREQLRIYDDFADRDKLGIIGAHARDSLTGRTPYAEDCQGSAWIEAPVVITSGSLTSVAAFEDIGPFREDFFIDGVDQEYCLRLRRQGYRVLIACGAELRHNLGRPESRRLLWREVVPTNHSAIRRYYMARNRILIAKEHFVTEPRWVTQQLVALIKATILLTFLEQDKAKKLKSIALGIWHGIIGRTGSFRPKYSGKVG